MDFDWAGADEDTILRAHQAIDEVSQTLESTPTERPRTLRHAETGPPVAWVNPAAGQQNPVAPPMKTHHGPGGRCWSDFTLGTVYEGPPGLVHGGICALLLDQLLGDADGPTVEAEGVFIMPAWVRDATG